MILLITIIIILADQASKTFFSGALALNKSIPVINNIFHLTLIHNTGIAFGFLKDSSKFILIVTFIGIALVIYSLKKDLLSKNIILTKKELILRKSAIGFILGGAVGNMIDRIRFGFVIDFLDFRVWPVFNLADSFITIGAVILFFSLFFKPQREL